MDGPYANRPQQHAHGPENHIDEPAQGTQRVVLRNTLFEADVAEHRRPGIFLAAHGSGGKLGRGNQPIVYCRGPARGSGFLTILLGILANGYAQPTIRSLGGRSCSFCTQSSDIAGLMESAVL